MLAEGYHIRLNYSNHIRRKLRSDTACMSRVSSFDIRIFYITEVSNKHKFRVHRQGNPCCRAATTDC